MGETDGVEDDGTIADDCRMLRRIPPGWIAAHRPDSSNFLEKDKDSGLSVTAWIIAEDLDIVLSEAPGFGVVCVDASDLRNAGYAIARRPLEGNDNHCECYGAPTKGARKQLSRLARWVAPPASHDPEPYGALEEFV